MCYMKCPQIFFGSFHTVLHLCNAFQLRAKKRQFSAIRLNCCVNYLVDNQLEEKEDKNIKIFNIKKKLLGWPLKKLDVVGLVDTRPYND